MGLSSSSQSNIESDHVLLLGLEECNLTGFDHQTILNSQQHNSNIDAATSLFCMCGEVQGTPQVLQTCEMSLRKAPDEKVSVQWNAHERAD